MEEVEIIYDSSKCAAVYARYFRHGRNQMLRHTGVVASLICGAGITVIGLALPSDFLIYVGLIVVGIVIAWLVYSIVLFKHRINKTIKHYEKYYNAGSHRFVFAFNETGVVYRYSEASSEFKWSYVSKYEINGRDAYLYHKTDELIDIISADVLGEDKFRKFYVLLKQHCKY